jgi:hypothetical protein
MLTRFKPNYLFNTNISDYCRKCTNDSIIKMTEKYTLERNKPKIQNPFDDKNNDKPKFSIYDFLIIFTISTMTLFFYKRLK